MAILFYTTTVSPAKTIGEIMETLSSAGAKEITVQYDDSNLPVALCFSLSSKGQKVFFALPCRWEGVFKCLENDAKVQRSMRTKEQALRTSWRILKAWVDAQMALIEAELATTTEVFFQYALTKEGTTIFQKLTTGNGQSFLM